MVLKQLICLHLAVSDIGPPKFFTSLDQLASAACDLRPRGGVDCPERVLSGLLMGLESSCPKSTVYVFTDAIAKDVDLLGKVLSVIQEKQIKVLTIFHPLLVDWVTHGWSEAFLQSNRMSIYIGRMNLEDAKGAFVPSSCIQGTRQTLNFLTKNCMTMLTSELPEVEQLSAVCFLHFTVPTK